MIRLPPPRPVTSGMGDNLLHFLEARILMPVHATAGSSLS
jgi:hypothetical protein